MTNLVYWKYETSGRLRKVVEKYLHSTDELTSEERDIFACYLGIWLASFTYSTLCDPSNPQKQYLTELKTRFASEVACGDRSSIDLWLEDLAQLGIDPL